MTTMLAPTKPIANGHHTKVKRVGIYLRVSTDRQAEEGVSLRTQRTEALAYAESRGYIVVDVYEDALSGLSADRPNYQRMLRDIDAGLLDLVIVWRYDRLGRNPSEYYRVIEHMAGMGVQVVSVTEGEGEEIRDLQGVLGPWESRRISRRVIPNKCRQAEQGYWNGKAPLGYEVVRVMPDGSLVPLRELTPDRAKIARGSTLQPTGNAGTVKATFEMYAAGHASIGDVAKFMANNGMQVSRAAIHNMLRSVVYTGHVLYGARSRSKLSPQHNGQPILAKGLHEPIVDEITFQRVQERLGQNFRRQRGGPHAKHMLTGLLYCGLCGAKMTPRPIDSGVQFRCTKRANYGTTGEHGCTCPTITNRKIDRMVAEQARSVLSPLMDAYVRGRAKRLFDEQLERDAQSRNKRRPDLERQREQAEKRLTALEDKYLDGDIAKWRYVARRDGLTAEIQRIDNELAQLSPVASQDAAEALRAMDSIDFDNLTDQEWRKMLILLVERVIWDGEKAVIEWKAEWRAILEIA